MPLHLPYILHNFKFSKIIYESFRGGSFVDSSIVLSIKHWMTYRQRVNRLRYSKKLMLNY